MRWRMIAENRHRRRWLPVLCFSFILPVVFCSTRLSTADLLDANSVEGALSVDTPVATMNVSSQRTFTVTGGKKPYSVKVLGSGAATVTGARALYTSGALIDNVSLNISDAFNRIITVSIDVQGVGIQPSSISGLALWLKADSLSYASGAEVTTWSDASGNGRDFATGNGSAGQIPTYVTGFANGLPVVSFNGTNQYFQYPASTGLNPSQFTFFILHYPEDVAGLRSPYTSRGSIPDLRGYYIYTGSSSSTSFVGIGGPTWVSLYSLTNITANTWYASEIMVDSQTFSASQNGLLQGQLSLLATPFKPNLTDASNPLSPARIGAGTSDAAPSLFFQGKVAEIMLFNRALSAGERQGIRC